MRAADPIECTNKNQNKNSVQQKNKNKNTKNNNQRSKVIATVRSGNQLVPLGNSVVFPPRWRRTFTASGQATLTGDGGGSIRRQSLSLNSLYDPDYSGVGEQPRYFQTLFGNSGTTTPYQRFCVLSARVYATFVSVGSTDNNLADVGIYVRPYFAGVLETGSEMHETEMGKAATIGSGYSGNGIVSIEADVTQRLLAQMQNCKDLEDCEANTGYYNGDPSVEILMDLMWCPYLTASTASCIVRWVVEYDALCFTLVETDPLLDKKQEAKASPVHVTGCLCTQCAPTKPHAKNSTQQTKT